MTVRYYNQSKKSYIYVDISSTYTLDQKDMQVKNNDAVLNCFTNLICTPKNELWFNPTYGTDIIDLIFDNAVQSKATRIFNKAYSACQLWLPMVNVIKNDCALSLDSIRGICKIKWVLSINQANPVTLGMTITGDV